MASLERRHHILFAFSASRSPYGRKTLAWTTGPPLRFPRYSLQCLRQLQSPLAEILDTAPPPEIERHVARSQNSFRVVGLEKASCAKSASATMSTSTSSSMGHHRPLRPRHLSSCRDRILDAVTASPSPRPHRAEEELLNPVQRHVAVPVPLLRFLLTASGFCLYFFSLFLSPMYNCETMKGNRKFSIS